MNRLIFRRWVMTGILFSAVAALYAGQSGRTVYSWGSVQMLPAGSGTANLLIRFEPVPTTAKMVTLTRREIFYAISPNEEIQCTLREFSRSGAQWSRLFRSASIPGSDDTSMIVQTPVPIDIAALSTAPAVTVAGYGWYRGFYIARIEITPFFREPGTDMAGYVQECTVAVTKKNSFRSTVPETISKTDPHFQSILKELIVNFDEAQPYRMPAASDSTGSWFNSTSKYVKLAIGSDAIYRITPTKLANLFPGITSVDPRTFQLFDRGIEIPIYVSGESDGVFDASDYIEFPALRNYTGKHRIITKNIAEEYNEYLNRYTDTTFLWLTWGVTNGKRLASNLPVTPTPDTLNSYTVFQHIEKQGPFPGLQLSLAEDYAQQDYRWNPFDLWPMDFLNGNGLASVTFPASDIALNGDSVVVYAKFASWGTNIISGAHKLSLQMNGSTDLNRITLNRGDQAVLSARTGVSSLNNGQNTLSLFSAPTSANPNTIIYDWFEVEYPRQMKAAGDTLALDFRTLPDRKLRNAKITALQSPNILVYKIKPTPERISNFSLNGTGPYTLTFTDTIGPQEQYIVIPNSKVYTPGFRTIKNFINIRANTTQADYIAITHSKFYFEALQFIQTVESAKNLTTRLFLIDDLFDEFAFGYPTSEAVRGFVRSTMRWNAPVPSYLVLLGDASYDYKFYYNRPDAVNYVPAFGYPVSDEAFALMDTVTNLPQMYVGRIPVNNVGELTQYRTTYSSYINTPNDDWNKRFLFFTGGDPANPGQIEIFKSVHEQIVTTMAKPAPIGGLTSHFYKTVDPQSDFGPFSNQVVKDAIATGGIFISYIGHSGTETWDNSIGDPLQLKNSRNRFSLITDFGCSTVKFAEPLIKSFSETFVVGPAASAIAYIGNSSLGFQSLAATLPQQFYSAVLRDSIVRIGKTHLTAKLRKIGSEGLSTANQIMLFNNTMIGDPTVDLKIQFVPNLIAQPAFITTPVTTMTDDQDSVAVTIVYGNFGSVTKDSVDIAIQQSYLSQTVRSWAIRRPMPLIFDTLTIHLSVKRRAGDHTVSILLDPQNKITESQKNDNSATKVFFVTSTDFKIVQPPPMSVSSYSSVVLLNPTTERYDPSKIVLLEIDTLPDYSSVRRMSMPMGVVSTAFSLSGVRKPARYYWRAQLQGGTGSWSTGSFYLGTDNVNELGQLDSTDWMKNTFYHTSYSSGAGSSIQNTVTTIRVISSGNLDGKFGVVEINGVNKLASTFSVGHSIVVIDPVADTVVKKGDFDLYNNPAEADSLVKFLSTMPVGYLVAATIIDEGSYNLTTSAKNAYHNIGSQFIDSVGYRDSWAILGRKGASPGTVLESFKKSLTGKAVIDTTIVRTESFGTVTTTTIGPVSTWKTLSINRTVPAGGKQTVTMLGITKTGTVDTLFQAYDSSTVDLSSVSAAQYPHARLLFSLTANSSLVSPIIRNWYITGQSPTELVISQNTVLLQKSVLQEGELMDVGVKVFNVGAAKADSVLIVLETNDSGTPRTLKSLTVPTMNAGDSALVVATYDSRGKRGNHSFIFEVDPNNTISELYKTNNKLSIPYTVLPDTLRPMVDILFDGAKILEDDFVSSHPDIRIRFFDNNVSQLTQADTSNFKIRLDRTQIYFDSPSVIQLLPGSGAIKGEIRWSPALDAGEHRIEFYVKDASGNYSDTTVLYVRVSNTLILQDVYAIPNPFPNGTHFTFTVAGAAVPDEVRIKIYTVAGRLIQELVVPPSDLRVGFNRMYWNGKDKDGDELANGVYLYRVMIRQSDQHAYSTEKLVKMR